MKRIDQMTEEELRLAEDAALNDIGAANRQVKEALDRVRDIHTERFARWVKQPRRRQRKPKS